jgi:ABC-type nickel/cobalt efflux system permease component RcnA
VGGITAFFTDFLVRKDLTVAFALLSVLASVAFGVLHALAPGHGKTVMAAYLVGQRGTRRQALQLGSIVTFTHTASVLALGALLTLGTLAAPERVVPLTEVLSGLLLAGLGIYLLVPALRRMRAARQHQRQHDHAHDHEHAHEHEQAHELEHSHG